jgi:hypothetical protein
MADPILDLEEAGWVVTDSEYIEWGDGAPHWVYYLEKEGLEIIVKVR